MADANGDGNDQNGGGNPPPISPPAKRRPTILPNEDAPHVVAYDDVGHPLHLFNFLPSQRPEVQRDLQNGPVKVSGIEEDADIERMCAALVLARSYDEVRAELEQVHFPLSRQQMRDVFKRLRQVLIHMRDASEKALKDYQEVNPDVIATLPWSMQ